MKFARFGAGGKISHRVVEADKIRPIEGDLLSDRKPAAPAAPSAGARLLAPVVTGQMLAVALWSAAGRLARYWVVARGALW